LDRVREIIPYQEPSPVPGGEYANLGMLTLRDEVIAIFSGRRLLSLEDRAYDENDKIVTFFSDNGVFGIAVDAVSEILYIDPGKIDHTSEPNNGQLIRGTVQHEDRLYIILDCAGVVQAEIDD
jgi:purine-binding chemotaxis protein CheW